MKITLYFKQIKQIPFHSLWTWGKEQLRHQLFIAQLILQFWNRQIANKNRQRKHSSIPDIGRKFLLAKTAKKFVNVSGSNILVATCTSLTVQLTSHDRRKSNVEQAARNIRAPFETAVKLQHKELCQNKIESQAAREVVKKNWHHFFYEYIRKSVDRNNGMDAKESSILYLLDKIHHPTSDEIKILEIKEGYIGWQPMTVWLGIQIISIYSLSDLDVSNVTYVFIIFTQDFHVLFCFVVFLFSAKD